MVIVPCAWTCTKLLLIQWMRWPIIFIFMDYFIYFNLWSALVNYSHQVLLAHNVPGLFSRKHSVKDFVLNSLNKSGNCVYMCFIAYCNLCIHSLWSTLTKEQIRQIYLITSLLLLLLLWDNLNALKKFRLWTLFCWWLFKKRAKENCQQKHPFIWTGLEPNALKEKVYLCPRQADKSILKVMTQLSNDGEVWRMNILQ